MTTSRGERMVHLAKAAYEAVSSNCGRWGHCRDHEECCYCREAARVWAEMIQMFWETEKP